MNTITQLVPPTKEPALNEQGGVMSNDDLRKLLLVDCLTGSESAGLIKKLSGLESSALEVSKGVDDLYSKVSTIRPDVLVLSVELLDKLTLEQLTKLHESSPLPVIVVAHQYSKSVVETVVSAGVSSYLVNVEEISSERLGIIIDLSLERLKQEQSLICELQATKEKLSERKLIERAKGIIMKQKHLSEEEAYSQMRKSAMNQGQSMADLAKRIISVFDMLE
ncbi:MAG: ANTAR domain-containing protein [Acidiferrobacterales bacterium]|nr:ANTAR domain-containing protein [Acidiferrobacterales bacterium]